MKCQSNLQFPKDLQRWKDGQWIYFFNHQDNGAQTDEKAGSRYEADFVIADGLTIEAALNAITRLHNDPALDQKITENIQVNGKEAVFPIYQSKVAASVFPPLPATGNLKAGEIYSYNNGAVMVVQDHARTIYAPELTPALFSFYREVTEGQPWIVGEQISLNATRTYNGKTYKCIQAHQSQDTWNPELTTDTLWQVVVTSSEWVAGVAYKVNDVVTYQGKTFKCLQAHTSISTWYPSAVPALWELQ